MFVRLSKGSILRSGRIVTGYWNNRRLWNSVAPSSARRGSNTGIYPFLVSVVAFTREGDVAYSILLIILPSEVGWGSTSMRLRAS